MRKSKLLFFPSYVTALYNKGAISTEELMESDKWSNIFSGMTVKKIEQLNSYSGGGDQKNSSVLNLLGLNFLTEYVQLEAELPPKFNLLTTLMSDGRESEVGIIYEHLHNYGCSFEHVRTSDGTYLIFFNDFHELDNIANRYVKLRSNMGKLIDDMSSFKTHDDLVCEPIVKSYMNYKI